MTRRLMMSVVFLVLAAAGGRAAAEHGSPAASATFTRIDVPGALVTVASGINGDGYIVGWYCTQLPCSGASGTEANPRIRGFVRDPAGNFSTLDANDCHPVTSGCHHAIGTQARYVSPQGLVIGDYLTMEDGATPGNPRFRGFVWFAGTFSYFDAPAEIYDNPSPPYPHSIIPRAINANGDIVGCIHDKNQGDSMYGFVLHDGTFTRLSDNMTMQNGINAQGEVVGLDNSSTGYHIDRFGNVERLNLPGAAADDWLDAWDINSRGDIVGQAFTDHAGVGHAVVRTRDGLYSLIDPPETSSPGCLAATGGLPCSSAAFGVAGNGSIVGQYRDSFTNCAVTACVHGFLRQRTDD